MHLGRKLRRAGGQLHHDGRCWPEHPSCHCPPCPVCQPMAFGATRLHRGAGLHRRSRVKWWKVGAERGNGCEVSCPCPWALLPSSHLPTRFTSSWEIHPNPLWRTKKIFTSARPEPRCSTSTYRRDGSPWGAPVWAALKPSPPCQVMKNRAEGSLARFPARVFAGASIPGAVQHLPAALRTAFNFLNAALADFSQTVSSNVCFDLLKSRYLSNIIGTWSTGLHVPHSETAPGRAQRGAIRSRGRLCSPSGRNIASLSPSGALWRARCCGDVLISALS